VTPVVVILIGSVQLRSRLNVYTPALVISCPQLTSVAAAQGCGECENSQRESGRYNSAADGMHGCPLAVTTEFGRNRRKCQHRGSRRAEEAGPVLRSDREDARAQRRAIRVRAHVSKEGIAVSPASQRRGTIRSRRSSPGSSSGRSTATRSCWEPPPTFRIQVGRKPFLASTRSPADRRLRARRTTPRSAFDPGAEGRAAALR
jgi:hypothetical protein